MRPTRGTLAPLAELRARSKTRHASGAYDASLVKFNEPFLRKHVGGLRPGHILCVGARTNVGKTHFLLHTMRAFPGTSLFLSLEDDEEEVVQRTDDADPDVDRRIIVSRPFPYTVRSVADHIREAHERFVWDGEPWLVCLDYIQLLVGDDGQPATYAIQAAVAEFRALGEELGFAGIMSAQISRPPKPSGRKREDEEEDTLPPRPTRFDLKDSASLENASTVIVLLHGGPTTDHTMAYVDKHKSAKSGGTCLYKKGPRGRLIEPRLGGVL